MLLRSPNLNFIIQRNRSTSKETKSTCSRKKCHFNTKALLWNQESERTQLWWQYFGDNPSVIIPLDKQVTPSLSATTGVFSTSQKNKWNLVRGDCWEQKHYYLQVSSTIPGMLWALAHQHMDAAQIPSLSSHYIEHGKTLSPGHHWWRRQMSPSTKISICISAGKVTECCLSPCIILQPRPTKRQRTKKTID